MRHIISFLIVLSFTFILSNDLIAQGTGTIEGVIIEAETNEPLFGANALVTGTSKGAAADADGRFTIRAVPAGVHTLRISYLGYQTIEEVITVVAGETVNVEFEIMAAGIEGDEVTITSQRRGQVAAINEQLTSNTISNIVSKDRIQEMPDVNAAESIGRLPGIAIERSGGEANKVLIRGLSPKFSTITVNGVRVPSTGGSDRSVDLSLVSSNMLDGIEVKKANTPDMDADAIAGSVDLKLRDAPDELIFDFQAQGGYAQLQDYFGNYKFSGTVSNRFMDSKLGVIGTFNVDEYDRSADQMSAWYNRYPLPNSDKVGVRINGVNAEERTNIRGRTGGSILLDYRLPNNGKIAANTFYNQLTNDGITRINNIYGGRIGNNLNINEGKTAILTSAISYEQDFTWIQLDGGLSRSSSKSESPRNYFAEFRMESESEGFDDSFPRDSLGLQPIDVLQWSTPNDSTMVMGNTNIYSNFREEADYTVQFNATIPFDFGTEIDGDIKAGVKARWFDKTNDEEQIGRNWAYAGLAYNDQTGEPASSDGHILRCIYDQTGELNGYNVYQEQVVNGEDSEFRYIPIHYFKTDYSRDNFLTGEGEGGFPVGFSVNPDDMKAFIDAAENCYGTDNRPALLEDPASSRSNDYTGEERYTAAYIMSTINIGNYVSLIPGVRWEHDYSRYVTERYEVVNTVQGSELRNIDTLDVIREHNFILPMVHLQITPNDWLKIRLARTETLARPDYTQYIPRANIGGLPPAINANNTGLKPAHSSNYDVSVSVYQNYIGWFSVSGFHKTIEDLPLWKRSSLSTVDSLPNAEDLNIPTGRDFDGDGEPDEPDWLTSNVSTVTTYINSPFDTKVWGVEFDWQTNFWYLPSVLEGLVLNINYTRMFSETSYQTTIFSHNECVSNCGTRFPEIGKVYKDTLRSGYRALDQPAHLANVTLGYDFKGFSARLSYLFQGDRLRNVASATEPVRDSYSATYERWDFTLEQRIKIHNTTLVVFSNFSNLSGTPDRDIIGEPGKPRSLGFGSSTFVQYYGFTMDTGVRLKF